MAKTVPKWYGKPWGRYDQTTWDEAVDRAVQLLRDWSARRHHDTYGVFVEELGHLDWPDGAFTGHGTQVGDLLGNVGIHEWLEDRPLTSALVVLRDEGGGKGLPGLGWFDFCRRLGLMADDKDLGQQLQVWNDQVQACFSGANFLYPTERPDW